MTVEKPKPKQLLRPIATGANSAMNQSQFLAITCNSLEEREKSRAQGGIGFGFASHWLKNWRESFKPITKRSNRNHFRQSFENCSMWFGFVIGCVYKTGSRVGSEMRIYFSRNFSLISSKRVRHLLPNLSRFEKLPWLWNRSSCRAWA